MKKTYTTMTKLYKNTSENYESLVTIKIDHFFKKKFPIAYRNKVKEAMNENRLSEKDAERVIYGMEIELELYYEEGCGFFAVESDAVECGANIYSPYTKEELVYKEDDGKRDKVIRLFKEQPWYEEWRKEYALHPSIDGSEEKYLNITSPFVYTNDTPFTWTNTEKGYDYWSDINNKWIALLSDKGFNEKDYKD